MDGRESLKIDVDAIRSQGARVLNPLRRFLSGREQSLDQPMVFFYDKRTKSHSCELDYAIKRPMRKQRDVVIYKLSIDKRGYWRVDIFGIRH